MKDCAINNAPVLSHSFKQGFINMHNWKAISLIISGIIAVFSFIALSATGLISLEKMGMAGVMAVSGSFILVSLALVILGFSCIKKRSAPIEGASDAVKFLCEVNTLAKNPPTYEGWAS